MENGNSLTVNGSLTLSDSTVRFSSGSQIVIDGDFHLGSNATIVLSGYNGQVRFSSFVVSFVGLFVSILSNTRLNVPPRAHRRHSSLL